MAPIKRLPIDPGPAAWNALLPAPPPPTLLEGDRTADWAVIGGGFAGLSAAGRLAQLHPGDTIAVLEAKRLAEGPAGRNSGFMIDLPHDLASHDYGGGLEADRAAIKANRHAIAFAQDMVTEFALPREAFATVGSHESRRNRQGRAAHAGLPRTSKDDGGSLRPAGRTGYAGGDGVGPLPFWPLHPWHCDDPTRALYSRDCGGDRG